MNIWGVTQSNYIKKWVPNPQAAIYPGSYITFAAGHAPVGWVDAVANLTTDPTNPSTFNPYRYADFQWCNQTWPTACTGTGNILSGANMVNLVMHAAGSGFTCTGAPGSTYGQFVGCMWPVDSLGLIQTNPLGYAQSSNCAGNSEPCNSFNMSASFNFGVGHWRSDNLNDPAGPVGCQGLYFPNCGELHFNVSEPPTTGINPEQVGMYARVGSLTIGSPNLYVGRFGGTYASPKTITFIDITPGSQKAGGAGINNVN